MDRYSPVSRALHWATALLIIFQVKIALTLNEVTLFNPDRVPGLTQAHASLGIVLMIVILWRIVERVRSGAPKIESRLAPLAHMMHGVLYLLLIGMVVTGYVKIAAGGVAVPLWLGLELPAMVQNTALAEQARAAHTQIGRVLVVLILTHVVAALAHGSVLRDPVFYKMLPGDGRPKVYGTPRLKGDGGS
jgi:cytochrome b561